MRRPMVGVARLCAGLFCLPLAAWSASSVPSAMQGTWTPLSRALERLHAMTLSANSIVWPPCQGHAIRPVSASASGIVLALQDARCELDGAKLTHMVLQPRAGSCDAELSLFVSADAYAHKAPQAWGLVTLDACKPAGTK